MTDVFDRAQEREAELRDDALADRARAAHAHDDPSCPTHCCFCGDRIPAARRRALPGVRTCVECQADVESGRLAWADVEEGR